MFQKFGLVQNGFPNHITKHIKFLLCKLRFVIFYFLPLINRN